MAVATKKNDYITRTDLDAFGEKLRREIVDEISEVIAQFASHVDKRFNDLEERVTRLEEGLDRLTNTIDGFIKRLDDIEAHNAARDAELTRMKRWIEQTAKQTGVKLEY